MSLPSIPSVPLASAVNYTVTDTTCSVGDLSDPVLQLVLPSIGGLIPGGFDPATFPTACNIECIGRASFVPTDSTNLILSLGADGPVVTPDCECPNPPTFTLPYVKGEESEWVTRADLKQFITVQLAKTDAGFDWSMSALSGAVECTATLTGSNTDFEKAISAISDANGSAGTPAGAPAGTTDDESSGIKAKIGFVVSVACTIIGALF